MLSASTILAQSDRITLEVLLTAGRNPNVNVVQDYGPVSWTEILEQEFQKLYPHVDVVFRAGTMEQATVMIAAGMGPDIINGGHTDFVTLGRNGAFVDLVPLLAQDGIDYMADQTFWPPQWEAYQWKGQQFGLPQYLGTIAMMYNADLFAEAGIVDPDPNADTSTLDWYEFESIAKKLTRDRTGDGVPDVWGFNKTMRTNRVYYWMKAAGAEFYGNEDRTVSTLDSPEAMSALAFLQSLRYEAAAVPPAGVSPNWMQGEVAIMEQGSWALVNYLGLGSDGRPKVSFEWNLFPMPLSPAGDRATMATIDGYAINKNTRYPDEAYALLKFLAGPVANEILAKYLALQPAHRDVVPEYISLMRELNRDVYDINVHVFTDAGSYAHPQTLYADQTLANSLLNEGYTKIFDEHAAVGTVWPDIVNRMNVVLASAGQEATQDVVEWQGERWLTQDFNTSVRGSATVNGQALTITADGNDIWGSKDGFRYVWQEVEGNFTATVRLDSVPDTNNWSKSGIMLRVTDTPEAANVAVLGTLQNGVVMQERLIGNASSRTAGRTSWTSGSPVYLRITRNGNRVTGSMSTDGQRWTELSVVTIDLPAKVLIGPASTSHAVGVPGDATFSQWQLVRH